MTWFPHTPRRPRKVLLLSKGWLALPGALLCACALCLVTTLPAYVTASAPQRQLPVYCVQRDYKVCSLTFDAAWGDVILRTLGHKGFMPQPVGWHAVCLRPGPEAY